MMAMGVTTIISTIDAAKVSEGSIVATWPTLTATTRAATRSNKCTDRSRPNAAYVRRTSAAAWAEATRAVVMRAVATQVAGTGRIDPTR